MDLSGRWDLLLRLDLSDQVLLSGQLGLLLQLGLSDLSDLDRRLDQSDRLGRWDRQTDR